MSANNQIPLVSITCPCRNRAHTIQRSIESVLNQTYRNIEFVIQDGASTDGTVEIIKSYNDDRIKLVSEPDSGIGEAHWKVLNRCRGDIIGTCFSDDELLPDAVENAVKRFRAEPHLGAATGDSYICDGNGKITGEHVSAGFDLVKYLFGTYCPFLPATFFKHQALRAIGLGSDGWELDSLEYEIWFRIGTQHQIKYFPGFVSKYAIHQQQSSHDFKDADIALEGWLRLIEKWFSKDGFFGDDVIKKNACIYNRLYAQYNHFRAYNVVEQTAKLYRRIQKFKRQVLKSYSATDLNNSDLFFDYSGDNESNDWARAQRAREFIAEISSVTPAFLKKLLSERIKTKLRDFFLFFNRILHFNISSVGEKQALDYWFKLVSATPTPVKQSMPYGLKNAVARAFIRLISSIPVVVVSLRRKGSTKPNRDGNPIYSLWPLVYSSKLYTHVANLYHARGQIDEALQMWRAADNTLNPTADGHMCSAILMSPTATHESISELQDWWAGRHAKPLGVSTIRPVPYRNDRKIRVGYHCSWIDSTTFLAIMSSVLKAHDRSKFTVCGYSAYPSRYDYTGVFDCFRITAGLSDEQYLNLVRDDKIDILIEISGFSDGNRFPAMASRGAPIQVAYVNHHATTGVPTIDYLITDEICVPAGEERFFSEKLYRIPVSFLCYNYEFEQSLPVSPPPKQRKGFVTFGCFGHGAKLNTELIELWSTVLHRVPRSVILICNTQFLTGDNKQFVADRFLRFGITPDRLRLIDGTDRARALRYLSEVDISLDTFPYNGGNAIAESLWHGAPVVTLKGSRCASRYGASLVTAAGCSELIAETPEQYVAIAEALSRDDANLAFYRQNLRDMMYQFGLSDAKKFAPKLEAAYEEIMRDYHHA